MRSRVEIDKIMVILQEEAGRLKVPVLGIIAEETRNPFKVLISCLLSLRTRDETTATASARLYLLAETPSAMMKLRQEKIEKAIYPVSFYRNKSRHILAICQILEDEYGGKVPDQLEALLKLPGVGRKTANLVITVAFNKAGICVDTHVHRISNRLGFIRTSSPEESETALREKLPGKYWIHYNDILVPFGQYICTPISPFCSRCAVKPFCSQKGLKKHR
ncbi:MAG: endonuclease III [Nitrospira sp.]|nr:endonuclease III [Candidatus Manganitrophaceae bacterium]HIL34264.1 endonuclease III [Candidatus Manganitrophaceae bacterium]